MYALDTDQNRVGGNLQLRSAQYYNQDDGISQDGNDLSVIDNGDLSPTGAGAGYPHNRQPSFLTKDFNISRHERRKSAMELESNPTSAAITISDPDGLNLAGGTTGHPSDLIILGKASQGNKLTSMALNSSSLASGVGNHNDKHTMNNRRRIKSFLPPGDSNNIYASNLSAMSSTPLEENSSDLANRGKDQRNSAYQAIQARLKA